MKLAKLLLMGVMGVGMCNFLVGCGGGTPEEVTADEDFGTSDEGMDEMEQAADVGGLEGVE